MGKKSLKKLAEEYINNGQDLLQAMEKTGYNTQQSAISRMQHSDRFRQALREECTKMVHRARALVARTGRGLPAVKASECLYRQLVGQDPPGGETPSTAGGQEPDNKDEGLPESTW